MSASIDSFLKRIYARKYQSVWTCTLGQNQSGKTDWNLYQLERLHALKLGDAFGANIPIENAPFDIDFIEDFQTLKKRCQMLNPDPKRHGIRRYFFLGSEMGDWAPKDQPWLNVKFIKELQQVRKYGLSFLGDAIARVDSRILNEKHFHGYFEKVSKANPTIAIYHDWFNRRQTKIVNIPRTKLSFDTWYSASFYMEPQTETDLQNIPLNREHEMIKQYLETESWDKTEYSRKQGQRAVFKVLRFHMKHCLNSIRDMPSDEVAEG